MAKKNMITTIKIHQDTKLQLDQFREHMSESYDEVIKKVVFVARKAKTEPELSQETVEAIERARERIKQGKYITWEEAKRRMGL
jgi:predicted transcriptional regulator